MYDQFKATCILSIVFHFNFAYRERFGMLSTSQQNFEWRFNAFCLMCYQKESNQNSSRVHATVQLYEESSNIEFT